MLLRIQLLGFVLFLSCYLVAIRADNDSDDSDDDSNSGSEEQHKTRHGSKNPQQHFNYPAYPYPFYPYGGNLPQAFGGFAYPYPQAQPLPYPYPYNGGVNYYPMAAGQLPPYQQPNGIQQQPASNYPQLPPYQQTIGMQQQTAGNYPQLPPSPPSQSSDQNMHSNINHSLKVDKEYQENGHHSTIP